MKRYSLWLILFFFSQSSIALENYYGAELAAQEPKFENLNIKQKLFEVLSRVHVTNSQRPDQILSQCPSGSDCFQHRSLGYREARRVIFGDLFLQQTQGQYALPDIYCDRILTADQFPKNQAPGPGKIPANQIINAEHTWPQSKFSRKFPEHLQKSDLHILFPTSSSVNSLRGNHPFGDVVTVKTQVCPASSLGYLARGNSLNHFLPPPDFRGNVARAVFYFSVRYNSPVDQDQEEAIRRWNHSDPVDSEELARHAKIFSTQRVRNPFVDHPEWVDLISDF